MSKEHLIPRKRPKLARFWWRGTQAWMATDERTGASGDKPEDHHPTDIEALEERRGSVPLARLMQVETDFFDIVERGNLPAIEKFLNDHRSLNINCINYKGLNALHIAIKKQHAAIVQLLMRRTDLEVKDAALHAIATGNTDLAEVVLDQLNKRSPGSEMKSYQESPDYSADITPLILAAQLGDYEMVRMLLGRGHKIEKPHTPSCLCPKCKEFIREAGAASPQFRLNAYKAISNPAYIVQMTNDPIFYGFLLDRELQECAITDKELRAEYIELAQEVRDFTVSLLSKCRNTEEIETLLKLPWGYEGTYKKIVYPRILLAIDYKQKEFVAHSMVQQVLSSYWLGDFIKWPRLRFWQKCLHILVRAILLPFICIALLMMPQMKFLKKLQSPVNRYLLNLASYMVFLLSVFMLNYLDTGNFSRGPPRTGFEVVVIIFMIGFIASTIRQCVVEGWRRFFSVPWHWYDMVMEALYVVTFILWFVSFIDVSTDAMNKKKVQERKFWHRYDATLLHEGLFAIATILSFGKLAYYCLQSSRLGPLQVSMGKMLTQIAYFLVFCFLIITCFSIPMARSYAYYKGMTQTVNGTVRSQLSSFSTFRSSFATFFWAMFCMSPVESTDVVVENLVKDKTNPVINTHDFTEAVGHILFATYELIMVIALVNTLIAILSNTFQRVVDNADVEFKFARTILWTHFFDEATMVPSPFNLILTPRTVKKWIYFCSVMGGRVPGARIGFSFTRCCYIKYDKEPEVDLSTYETLIANLVQRYFRAKEEE